MTQVVVDREVLEALLREMVDLREAYAMEGGAFFPSKGEIMYLHPEDEVVTLACQAGVPIPGVLEEGAVPPAPPLWLGRLTSPTYRELDGRLRCTGCGKVVYGNLAQAGKAAATINQDRGPMRAYLGRCGHYHLSSKPRR